MYTYLYKDASLHHDDVMCRETAAQNMEARLQAEELVRVEARARQEAEVVSQQMERQVATLQGTNQELMAEVERLTHLLLKKPTVWERLLP